MGEEVEEGRRRQRARRWLFRLTSPPSCSSPMLSSTKQECCPCWRPPEAAAQVSTARPLSLQPPLSLLRLKSYTEVASDIVVGTWVDRNAWCLFSPPPMGLLSPAHCSARGGKQQSPTSSSDGRLCHSIHSKLGSNRF